MVEADLAEAARLVSEAPASGFEGGSIPAEEPWLSDQVMVREGRGLDANVELVASLLRSERAQGQVAAYGVVLTADEEQIQMVRTARALEKQELLSVIEQQPGYGGSSFDVDTGVLTVFVAEWAENSLELTSGEEVAVEAQRVAYSARELDEMSAEARKLLRGEVQSSKVAAVDELVTASRAAFGDDLENIGFSIRYNSLTLQLVEGVQAKGRDAPLRTVVIPIRVLETLDTVEDFTAAQGAATCGGHWCGAPRGGHFVQFTLGGGGTCTLSPSVRGNANGIRDYRLTAGHCGTTSANEKFYMGGRYNGSLSNVAAHFNIQDAGGVASSFLGTEWQNTLERPGEAKGDFTLFGPGRHMNSNQMMISNTVSRRAVGFASSSVNDEICISAPQTRSKCDKVDDIGWVKKIQGKDVTNLVAVRGGYDAKDGDSGAPIYMKNDVDIFAGVHQGWKRDFLGRKFQLFSQASLIDQGNLWFANARVTPTDGKRDFVQNMYFRNLNRVPDVGGFNFWYNQLSPCNPTTAANVARGVLASPEFRNRVPANTFDRVKIRVEYAYRTYFGRTADAGGMAFWAGQLWTAPNKEAQWDIILAGFALSPEFSNRVNGVGYFTDGPICA